MIFAYGITTVPSRMQTTLPLTLASLSAAGFGDARLFIDGSAGGEIILEWGKCSVTHRHDHIGAMGNWILAAWELLIRNPTAERFVIFQDDIQAVPNLRAYLERCPYPKNGYLNLLTMEVNMPAELGLPTETAGWYLSNQMGKGAQSLVFDGDALHTLLSHRQLADKPKHARNAHKNIDGCVSDLLKEAGYQEWVHTPSLVQHVGRESVIGNTWKGSAPSFVEDFDPCLATR